MIPNKLRVARRILTATVWLDDVADFDKLNAVWEQWLDKANAPTRATGGVKLFGKWKVRCCGLFAGH